MELLRLSYKADMPNLLLVTCRWPEEDAVCTVAYDLATGDQQFVEADDGPAYKPALFRDEMLHAVRIGDGFEDRQIVVAQKIEFISCKLASLRQTADMPIVPPDIESADQVRESDLAGVEKHLGAAFALASEIAAGHAYRMRFVGHLHEAENECQSHPELHLLIRTARKSYQATEKIPDWDLLAEMLYAAMNDSK